MTRDELIRRVWHLARERRVAFGLDSCRLKGSHWIVEFAGHKQLVSPANGGDLRPGTLRAILHGLGLTPYNLE